MDRSSKIKSVAIIGAGAAGAVTAAAFAAEEFFEKIRVFERRETAGGTWIYDESPPSSLPIRPGSLPPDSDPPIEIPNNLPKITSPNEQERYTKTPVYSSLTTNVPAIAMSFSDIPFPYGPFVPHHVPKQYIESYFSHHKTDTLLSLNTTVEDVSVIRTSVSEKERWNLTLRKYDPVLRVDIWWEEDFDAVIFANGHYSVPFIPEVKGLAQYLEDFPGRVVHSKTYRTPILYENKKVLTIGNSASGHDVTAELVSTVKLPVFQSRRSKSRWDGSEPPPGIAWKPIIKEFLPSGRIVFEDDTYLDDIDTVIYCTGYKASFPFWNSKNNGREFWDYEQNKLIRTYLHTFFQDFTTLAIVGVPRSLTFRSFEYQAIALARLFSGRQSIKLPPVEEQEKWEKDREERTKRDGLKYHDIGWDHNETMNWLGTLHDIAGLGLLTGEGMVPPVFSKEMKWAIENLKKYPEPGDGEDDKVLKAPQAPQIPRTPELQDALEEKDNVDNSWVVVTRGGKKDSLWFI